MTTENTVTEHTDLADKLRAWAKGTVTEKPAVELLIRADNGRWLTGPWVKTRPERRHRGSNVVVGYSDGRPWIDWQALHYESGVYSSSERTFLAAAASLGSEEISINLSDTIVRLDPMHLSLLLTALRAAAQNDGEWPTS